MLMMLGSPTPASAGPDGDDATRAPKISTRVTDKGEVIAQVKLSCSLAKLQEVLGSAERAHGLAPTTVSVKATSEGKCERVQLRTKGLFSPFEVVTKRCPTATGWLETLVTSSDFLEYRNEWTLASSGDGVLVTFKTRTSVNVAVPESLILSQTKRVLGTLMRNLRAATDG